MDNRPDSEVKFHSICSNAPEGEIIKSDKECQWNAVHEPEAEAVLCSLLKTSLCTTGIGTAPPEPSITVPPKALIPLTWDPY